MNGYWFQTIQPTTSYLTIQVTEQKRQRYGLFNCTAIELYPLAHVYTQFINLDNLAYNSTAK